MEIYLHLRVARAIYAVFLVIFEYLCCKIYECVSCLLLSFEKTSIKARKILRFLHIKTLIFVIYAKNNAQFFCFCGYGTAGFLARRGVGKHAFFSVEASLCSEKCSPHFRHVGIYSSFVGKNKMLRGDLDSEKH